MENDDIDIFDFLKETIKKPSKSSNVVPKLVHVKTEPDAQTDKDETIQSNEQIMVEVDYTPEVSTNSNLTSFDAYMTAKLTTQGINDGKSFVLIYFTFIFRRTSMPSSESGLNSELVRRRGATMDKQNFSSIFSIENLAMPYNHMNFTANDISDAANEHVEMLCTRLANFVLSKQSRLSENLHIELLPVGAVSLTPALFIGRVVCDTEGRLNIGSILIEGPRSMGGNRTPLLFSMCKESVFVGPGQVIGVIGSTKEDGQGIIVEKVFHGLNLSEDEDKNMIKVGVARKVGTAMASEKGGLVHLMSASGPFGVCDTQPGVPTREAKFSFYSLKKVLEKADEEQPHAIILLGPFLPCTDPVIQNRLILDPSGIYAWGAEEIWQSFFMNEMILPFCQRNQNVQVVLVPHVDDLGISDFPVPQPPFSWEDMLKPKNVNKQPTNLHLASNPSNLIVGDVRIHISSHDAGRIIPFLPHALPANADRHSLVAQTIYNQSSVFWMDPLIDCVVEPSKRSVLDFDPLKTNVVITRSTQALPGAYKAAEGAEGIILFNPTVSHKIRPAIAQIFVHPPTQPHQNLDGDMQVLQNAGKRIRIDLDPLESLPEN